ncbi:Perphorin-2 [Tetrabaena socialis]|uniref:Perphorin-2 n=1 Tax=Tetrabaena socialis TaxID=47790 RepID=A0A2J7ZY93_9CHLO|nr:Perphorin-2 [Tetrabaena socialis]|eukprot:PNH05225.1 Perphorin-2 [Tetrabaena socialis]
MRSILFTVSVLLAWSAARGQDEVRAAGDSTPLFPYATCQRLQSRSIYSVSPATSNPAPGTYCWTVQAKASQCVVSNPCCTADLHKFDLDVLASCDVPQAKLSASINGRVLTLVDIVTPANGLPDQRTLRVSNLGLSPSNATGAVLCIKVRAAPAGYVPGACERSAF